MPRGCLFQLNCWYKQVSCTWAYFFASPLCLVKRLPKSFHVLICEALQPWLMCGFLALQKNQVIAEIKASTFWRQNNYSKLANIKTIVKRELLLLQINANEHFNFPFMCFNIKWLWSIVQQSKVLSKKKHRWSRTELETEMQDNVSKFQTGWTELWMPSPPETRVWNENNKRNVANGTLAEFKSSKWMNLTVICNFGIHPQFLSSLPILCFLFLLFCILSLFFFLLFWGFCILF